MFQLSEIDRELASKSRLKLLALPSGGRQRSRSGRNNSTVNVKFQFPPIVKSDNKTVNWKEVDLRSAEPFAYFMGAKAREILFKWTYIVTHTDGGEWDIETISSLVKNIRGYFYQSVSDNLIVDFYVYDVVGDSKSGSMSFRSDGINVDHSDTVIKDGDKYYPLRTDLSMKLKLWTNLGSNQYDNGLEGSEEVYGISGIRSLEYVTSKTAPSWF